MPAITNEKIELFLILRETFENHEKQKSEKTKNKLAMRILYEYMLEKLDIRAVNARSGVYCSYIQKIKGNRKTVLFAEDIGGMS